MLLSYSKVITVFGLLLFIAITAQSKQRRIFSDCVVRDGRLIMQRDGCKFTIKTKACGGGCLSSAKPFSHTTGFASSCSCCAPIASIIKERTVNCHGVKKVIRYPEVIRCACRPCLNG
ncbi:hypothetical protein OS493_023512 [Desmophyllum pertusum]|uniref:Glycoprotein hormone subunit beta domain-containing protein n=1 Tax=Desmophyllum pertusum TaxID=174260 RepID=A0A9W9ZM11_9CNID|nr:hypothetical protein OS493_023512 [Desmophyllum pertusum]